MLHPSIVKDIVDGINQSSAIYLAADALARGQYDRFIAQFHRALTDDAELNVLSQIAMRVGMRGTVQVVLTQLKQAFTIIRIGQAAAELWDTIQVQFTGSVAGTVQFESTQQQTARPTNPQPVLPNLPVPDVGTTPSDDPSAGLRPSGTAGPAAVTSASIVGTVLLSDNFSDQSSGWPERSGDYYSIGYVDHEYYVIRRPGSTDLAFATYPASFSDFQLDVDARLVDPAPGDAIVINLRRANNVWYRVYIRPVDGTYLIGLWRVDNSRLEATQFVPFTETSAIVRGAAWNHLTVRARGDELVVLVNDQLLAGVVDEASREGRMDLGVSGSPSHQVEARFRSLLLTSLD